MRLSDDSREFIALLNSRGVEYLIVGAYSLAFYGRPRFTGRVPNRIDLLTSISGVSEAAAFATKAAGELDGLPVNFLSRESLIANKRSVARPQDLADLSELEREAEYSR